MKLDKEKLKEKTNEITKKTVDNIELFIEENHENENNLTGIYHL